MPNPNRSSLSSNNKIYFKKTASLNEAVFLYSPPEVNFPEFWKAAAEVQEAFLPVKKPPQGCSKLFYIVERPPQGCSKLFYIVERLPQGCNKLSDLPGRLP
jgi:hypothetical protein